MTKPLLLEEKISIPHFDLTRQSQMLAGEIEETLRATLARGRFILGPEVKNFEEAFARYLGVQYAVGVGSGTDALLFSLKALGVTKGDEVIVPALTFVATAYAILHLEAEPVFADVHPETLTLDPASVRKRVTRRTRVILPVHLYGHPADMDPLKDLAGKRGIKIAEDACQAHGASWKGKKAGGLSDAGCFSFYPTKNLGAFGDGGMVVTSSAKIAEHVRRMRNAGRDPQGRHQELGWASRLDSVQAAVLNVKLKYLDQWNARRRAIAARYHRLLADIPLKLPREAKGAGHVYHLYAVRVPEQKRDALAKFLLEKGIETAVHYRLPVHRQPFYERLTTKNQRRLPIAEKVTSEILSLPLFPEMTEDEVDRVAAAISEFYA